jgi:hypothetical protein
MKSFRGRWRPLGITASLALICALAIPALSVAAAPKKGKTYVGDIKRVFGGRVAETDEISFQVSANGKRVHDFSLPNGYPVYCEGGGFGEAQGATAKITPQGTFTAKLPIYFAYGSPKHQGFVEVTGKFGKKGHESGKVITEFTKSTTCNGTSRYSTKVG